MSVALLAAASILPLGAGYFNSYAFSPGAVLRRFDGWIFLLCCAEVAVPARS